eukprot:CCRYP_011831-RA/>CCRYP_011831-RA protein AED:0.37 eAED:0.37 QI:0/0/0/1/1/1/2/0/402
MRPMQMSLAASAKALGDTPHIHTKSTLKALTLSSPSSITTSQRSTKTISLTPEWSDPYRTRITLGGDRIHYPGDCGTKIGSLETVKLLINSVLSTATARFASFDISNFYLGTPLDRPEYDCIKLTDIPDEFIQEYGLQDFAYNGFIYFEVTKEHYTVTTDWTGTKFAGIDITWDYTKRTFRLTMDTYITTLLLKYNHPQPCIPQHAPHKHREIIYGAKEQLLPDKDTSPPLDTAGIKRIQGIVGSLLYYARAVDNKLLVALSTISSQQTAATQNTATAVHQLLDYVAMYPNDGITYRASSMILAAQSDVSYLTEAGSHSRAGAHIFLSENDPIPQHNMPILTISQTIKYAMASAAEVELTAIYITARELIPLRMHSRRWDGHSSKHPFKWTTQLRQGLSMTP